MLVYDTLRRRRRFFGDTCSLRDSMREEIGIVAFLFLSSLRGAFSHEPSSSYRESRYRFRISERRCKARGIHVFLDEPSNETSMPTVDRESLSRARETRLYLGTREPLEPSPLSSPLASVTGRERKRAGRAPSTRNISTRGENVRIFLSFESYIEGIEEDRSICASGNLTRSIHALIRTMRARLSELRN